VKKVPSIQELWDMQPDKEFYGPYKRIGKTVGIYLTKLFLYTPISANQVTLLHGLVGIGGAWLLMAGEPLIVMLGALVIRGSGILDQVDGQLAYARKTAGPEGLMLDSLAGFLEGLSLFVFVFLGVYLRQSNWVAILFGITATLSYVAKELLPFIPKSILYTMLVGHPPWLETSGAVRKRETGGFVTSIVSIYNPSRRLPRLLGALTHHFNVVNLLVVGAAVDLLLYWSVPNVAARFSGLFAFLIIYSVLGSVDSVGRVAYIIHTGQIQRAFSRQPGERTG